MSTRTRALIAHYCYAFVAMFYAVSLAEAIMDGPPWRAAFNTLWLLAFLKWAKDAHVEAQQALRGTP